MEERTFVIWFTENELNTVLNALGNLPTSAGVWPLFSNIRDQAMKQVAEAGTPKSPEV